VIVTAVTEDTAEVVTGKVAEAVPFGTVTLVGTVAADEFELERETTIPPAGAWTFNVTVPVELEPPATLAGFTDTAESAGAAVTVRTAVFVTPE
jgi:hypothetical protein